MVDALMSLHDKKPQDLEVTLKQLLTRVSGRTCAT